MMGESILEIMRTSTPNGCQQGLGLLAGKRRNDKQKSRATAACILPSVGGGPCLRQMGIEGLAPGPRTSVPAKGHKSYPYLLRDLKITRPNQVWACNITYVPKPSRYLYLTAVITSFSRHVLAWPLSNSMDVELCIEAGDEALSQCRPQLFNTYQGSQYTSQEFTGRLLSESIQISMDGKGRAIDNVMIEQL